MPSPLQRLGVVRKRPATQVPIEGGLGPLAFAHAAVLAVLDPHGLDHRRWHALGAQLRLERHPPARGVRVPLLDPPSGEGHVVHEPDSHQASQGRGDDRLSGSGSPQSFLDLPARARPGPEEVARELERLLGVGCGPWFAGAGHRDQADAVSAGAVTSPIVMAARRPRMSSSMASAMVGLALRNSRAASRPLPSRVSP